jgi:uncharacterized membrane protein (UPF0182 family)
MGNVEIGEELPSRYLTGLTVGAAVVLGLLLALPPEPWTQLAAARYGVPFGETEPYFQQDFGFYVYWLPLENALYVRALLVLVGTVFVVIVLYVAVTPSLRWDRTRFRVTAHVRRHVAALTPCFFTVLAWNYRLEAYAVLSRGDGPGGLFTYTDHHFAVPADRVLALALLAAGVVAGAALWRGQLRTTMAVLTSSLFVLAAYHFTLPLIEHSVSGAVEGAREQPYAIIRSQATRAAYGVNRIAAVGTARAPIRFASLAEAVPHLSIWDPSALSAALPRTRRQAAVADVVGWQWSPSGLLAVGVEYGEDTAGADGAPLGAAHGALVPVRATRVDDRGNPERTDLEGHASTDEVPIAPVLIHAGAAGALIVADSLNLIAAPRVDGLAARVAEAWSAQQLSLLAAEMPEPRPKLVDRRDVRERLRALVPFFAQGSVIVPVLSADSLFWVVDLYSAADQYPLSEHFQLGGEARSYFQHAATAVIHAYTGRVMLVADSVRDPIAETWVRRFPGLFVPWSSVPPALAAQAPPPVDAGLAAADAFGAAGARIGSQGGPGGPAASQLPAVADNADTTVVNTEPPCVAMPLDRACAHAIPLIDVADRITGLVVATGGARRRLLWIPFDSSAPRWAAMLERLRRAGDSLAGRRQDGHIARGRVRAFVVGSRLAFAQPEYAWRADAPPTLLGVTTLIGDSVLAAPTLADAVGADTGLVSPSPRVGGAAGSSAFRARVAALYDSMQGALRRGDLISFGAAYSELGRLLGRVPENRAFGPRSH